MTEQQIRAIVREELATHEARRSEAAAAAFRELDERHARRLRKAPQFRGGRWQFPVGDGVGR